ncbi:hypothetical protein EGM85_11295 [Macrococcus caseolyticus]|nr:hypothetical protein [Macrococcus caseolyticus]RKO11941.1 hypothetical protein D6861_11295 [Macrococcus caseolyticus]
MFCGSDGLGHDVAVVERTALVRHVGRVHRDAVQRRVAAELGRGRAGQVLRQLLVHQPAVLLRAPGLAHGGDYGTVVSHLLVPLIAGHHHQKTEIKQAVSEEED